MHFKIAFSQDDGREAEEGGQSPRYLEHQAGSACD